MINEFRDCVEVAERILITSHTSPDPDATASVLLLGTTLALNYPTKKINLVLEEEPDDLAFLTGYQEIIIEDLFAASSRFNPQLIIVVDANNFERCSRGSASKLKTLIDSQAIKTAVLDHHEREGQDQTDIYINSGYPASVQEVYDVCFSKLQLNKPSGYAQTTMLGLYADTGGFAYYNPMHSATLALADELITAGADIEQIKNSLYQYTEDDMQVLSELTANATGFDDYSYSFITDDFISTWLDEGKTPAELHHGTEVFVNDLLRNIAGRQWGFIVYRNSLHGEDMYSISLRSVGTARDVSQIARKLNGGGHKPSAGGKIKAHNLAEAIEIIKSAIASSA